MTLPKLPQASWKGLQRQLAAEAKRHDVRRAASTRLISSCHHPRQKVSSTCRPHRITTLAAQAGHPLLAGRVTSMNFSSATMSDDLSSSAVSDGGAVTQRLEILIERGEIQPDDHQLQAASELDRIYDYLMANDPPLLQNNTAATPPTSPPQMSFFGSLFGSSPVNYAASEATAAVTHSVTSFFAAPKGAYMFGGVGCGKTFLMNLLYEAIDQGPWAQDKQKVHFHKFMLQVHQHMHQQRKLTPDGDLIAPVVREILKQGRLLCLDEFQVTDVADALILQRLFDGLWSQGCILIATSNRPPSDLYLHGLQRDRFLPFVDRLVGQCTVVDLLDSDTDYRMLAKALSRGEEKTNSTSAGSSVQMVDPVVYFLQGGSESSKKFRKLFYQLAENHPTNPQTLTTQGRKVAIPLGCTHKKIAFFDFSDLCANAMGAADYLVIANNFSTIFCHNIPKLTVNELNWLRRFITFVDTMYELKVTLVLHTAKPCESIDQIFSVEGVKEDYQQDEVFAYDRTLSRLEEMSSTKYLKSQWLGGSKKRRADQKASMYKAFPSYFKTSDDEDNERVVSNLSIQPSLDNHHLEPDLGDMGSPRTAQH